MRAKSARGRIYKTSPRGPNQHELRTLKYVSRPATTAAGRVEITRKRRSISQSVHARRITLLLLSSSSRHVQTCFRAVFRMEMSTKSFRAPVLPPRRSGTGRINPRAV